MTEVAKQTPPIEVNDYGPDLKSLGFRTREGDDATTGVLNPGQARTVSTRRKEMMILSKLGGDLKVTIPGMMEGVVYRAGSTLMLPADTQGIQLEAMDGYQVSYECVYIEDESQAQAVEAGTGTEAATGGGEEGVDTDPTAEAARLAVGA